MKIALTVAAILCVVAIGFTFAYEISLTEVETYSVGCEVSHMEYYKHPKTYSETYRMFVRNDDFAICFDVNNDTYAKYAEGDIVEVLVRVMEDFNGNLYEEYSLIDE